MSERDDFLDKTIRVFQPRTSRVLTREDARQMVETASAFFRVLLEWDAASRSAAPLPTSPAVSEADTAPHPRR